MENFLQELDAILESAKEYRELNDLPNNRYFKEYKHDEAPELASRKIEAKLSSINPGSMTIRHDNTSFTMIHPGGDLITKVETVKHVHYVATHYISSMAKDYKSGELEKVNKPHVLYEDGGPEYIVHDEQGKVYFRHRNLRAVQNSLSHIQEKFGHTTHKFNIDTADTIKESLEENYRQKTFIVKFSHATKVKGKPMNRTFKIDFAVDAEHAKRIATNIANKRKLKQFKLGDIE